MICFNESCQNALNPTGVLEQVKSGPKHRKSALVTETYGEQMPSLGVKRSIAKTKATVAHGPINVLPTKFNDEAMQNVSNRKESKTLGIKPKSSSPAGVAQSSTEGLAAQRVELIFEKTEENQAQNEPAGTVTNTDPEVEMRFGGPTVFVRKPPAPAKVNKLVRETIRQGFPED